MSGATRDAPRILHPGLRFGCGIHAPTQDINVTTPNWSDNYATANCR
jgi:hypothetical protein